MASISNVLNYSILLMAVDVMPKQLLSYKPDRSSVVARLYLPPITDEVIFRQEGIIEEYNRIFLFVPDFPVHKPCF